MKYKNIKYLNSVTIGPLDEIQNRQKYYQILKEHPKLSKIAKFGCEMF